MVTYDPAKNERNIAARGVSFDAADQFGWDGATIDTDQRRDYGEPRFVATGLIGGRLHVLVFTPRETDVRVISLRRANTREQAAHAKRTRSLSGR